MVLLERVATLLYADIERLLERTEEPRAVLHQLIVDMENQLLQVKTQVVIALTTRQLLEQKTHEQEELLRSFERVAASAAHADDSGAARQAQERVDRQRHVLRSYQDQRRDQEAEAGVLHDLLVRLQAKMAETRTNYAPVLNLGDVL